MRTLLLTAALATLAVPALAASPVESPVKMMIGAVRYAKDDLALKSLDTEAEGAFLLGADWAKATPQQRAEFSKLFQQLFAGLAFPKVRADLKYLETTLYESPKVAGDKATLDSTLVILNALKKQEIKVRYDLHKQKGAWKVVDVSVLGTGDDRSMLTGIRDEQIKPLMKDGGWNNLLAQMRARAAQIASK